MFKRLLNAVGIAVQPVEQSSPPPQQPLTRFQRYERCAAFTNNNLTFWGSEFLHKVREMVADLRLHSQTHNLSIVPTDYEALVMLENVALYGDWFVYVAHSQMFSYIPVRQTHAIRGHSETYGMTGPVEYQVADEPDYELAANRPLGDDLMREENGIWRYSHRAIVHLTVSGYRPRPYGTSLLEVGRWMSGKRFQREDGTIVVVPPPFQLARPTQETVLGWLETEGKSLLRNVMRAAGDVRKEP